MRGEYYLTRSQLRGYIFELVVLQLLRNNGFSIIQLSNFERGRVREERQGFIELKGRGVWHQIDCPCDYNTIIPFIYPIRLLGEVKFHSGEISKEHIREFIGVLKDIQENYFVSDNINEDMMNYRRTEIGVFFSANGFSKEAEWLAYAHDIKTISYKNNYLVDKVKNLIDELESNYLSVKCIGQSNLNTFKNIFARIIDSNSQESFLYNDFSRRFLPANGYENIISRIKDNLQAIQCSFFANTSTGVFLHLVSTSPFPDEVFLDTDNGECEVYYELNNHGSRYFYLTITGDKLRRRFYFTPPLSLSRAALFGKQSVLSEKERIFEVVHISIKINGINRNITLTINRDWLERARS